MLKRLAPDEEKMYAEGAEEVEELMEKLKKQTPFKAGANKLDQFQHSIPSKLIIMRFN